MHKNLFLIMLCAVMILLQGCGNGALFSDEFNTNEDGWNMEDKACFDVAVTDTMTLYDFFIDIRNSQKYAYANFFLFINTTFPDGGVAHDTLECPLADEEGHWLGRKSGRYIDNRYYLRKHVLFPTPGTYHFEICHGMRDTNVTGIKSVGLRIEPFNANH